ncbi:uncharacterized protein LOC110449865 [Mizuhopecten yessoensis]|uniref:Tripartite motif-containing protein 45 n=1 Tax=Mizuhopecten yessoensis TaxID=6573 RepID=A0A210QQ98_MIZYE|nr:uncharacterized protein LOC110449865 [Mizuhopecten yessoensis]XP_021352677.1 uncharacterized protein LOC110449865 [Mizuhopecten yessoensis]OWF50913.1 Tripartite motif-containing protein 45 [Mizuhopecten yessoensis]
MAAEKMNGGNDDVKNKMCSHHPDRKFDMVCITCKDEPICRKCISTTHIKHTCAEMEGYYDTKKDSFLRLVQKADAKVKGMNGKMKRLKKLQDQNQKTIDETVNEVKVRGRELKSKIDKVTENLIDECKSIGTKNDDAMAKLEETLEKSMNDLKQTIQKCKIVIGCEKFEEYALMERNLRSQVLRKAEQLPVLSTPSLSSNVENSSCEQLQNAYGSLSKKDWRLDKMGMSEEDFTPVVNQPAQKPAKLFTVSVLASFELSAQKYIRSVWPVDEHKSWVICGGSNEAHLVSAKGDMVQTSKVDEGVWITDVTCTADESKTMVCCGDGTIREILPSGDCKTMFHTECYANSLSEAEQEGCVTVCRHREQNLVRATFKGKIMQTINFGADGKPLFCKPVCIRVNRSNGDMVVLEANSPRHVVVFDKDLNLLTRYQGNGEYLGEHDENGSDQDEFQPWDVCFDRQGNIMIADGRTKSLILVDRHGQTIRTLFDDDIGPTCMGMCKNGDMWVGFDYGNVKVIRFANTS